MNDQIRQGVRDEMHAQGLTQEQLAQRLGIDRTHVNRMLKGDIGKMPDRWTALADALNMEIIIRRKFVE